MDNQPDYGHGLYDGRPWECVPNTKVLPVQLSYYKSKEWKEFDKKEIEPRYQKWKLWWEGDPKKEGNQW